MRYANVLAPGAPIAVAALTGCTQETQNQLERAVRNWTGDNGVLEIYAGDKLVRKFIDIDKISTASATSGSGARPYRFGYGVFDGNLNGIKTSEKRVYFEFRTTPRRTSSTKRQNSLPEWTTPLRYGHFRSSYIEGKASHRRSSTGRMPWA